MAHEVSICFGGGACMDALVLGPILVFADALSMLVRSNMSCSTLLLCTVCTLVRMQSWEGIEVGKYWQKVGKIYHLKEFYARKAKSQDVIQDIIEGRRKA